MRVLWPLLLLVPLAGCLDGEPGQTMLGVCERPKDVSNPGSSSTDWSLETLHVVVDGPHDLLIPVPVHRATNASQWADVAGAELVESAHGTMLHLVGAAPVDTTWCIVQPAWGGNGCCAEHFLGARWSSDATGDGTVWADVGAVRLDVTYTALSDWCGIDDAYWTLQGAGWQTTTADLGAWCA